MAKNIDPKLKKIGAYLKLEDDAIFSIPEYQRAYSWGIKHCDKLWQDIEAFIESGGNDPYFFGTIIINCQDNDSKLSLIDGQQRTTTFLLLLKAVLIRLISAVSESQGDEDSAGLHSALKANRDRIMSILYKAEDEDIPEMLKDSEKIKDLEILRNESNNEIYKTELANILNSTDFISAEKTAVKIPYRQKDNKYTNYFRNFKFFYDKLKELSNSRLNLFAKNILGKCEIIEIRSWQVEQAITMFNSLNSDGMPLLDADIISAQLYSEASKQNKAEEFNNNWIRLLQIVNKLETQRIADIDAIFMQYMYTNRAREKEYLTDKGSIDVTTPGLRRYYIEIRKKIIAAPLFLCDELIKLAEIWLKIKDYTIVKLLLKFNDNAKLYLAGYLSRYAVDEITEEVVTRVAECLLKLFAVLELVDTGYSSSKFKTFLFGVDLKLVDERVDISEIESDFYQHILQNWEAESIKKEILEYEKNILVYLNEYLVAKRSGIEFLFTEKYDIEHIMPVSGRNLSQIQADANIETREEFDSLVNKLGNKIMLEADINRSIGNEWFRTKIQTSVKDKCGYQHSQYPIAKMLVENYKDAPKPYWQKDDINVTTTKIAQRITGYIFE